MKRLKVLVIAYACSPNQGSEPGMGWGFVSEIAKFHDVWVICEEDKFKDEIEAELNKNKEKYSNVKFLFIKKERHRLLRKLWPPSYYWFYKAWHKQAYQLASQLHEKYKFDLMHQLNMVGFREPGFLWKIDVPFVWGPVGGLNQVPMNFLTCMGWKGAFFYLSRNIFNYLQQQWLSRPKLAAHKANKGLIAASVDTQVAMNKIWQVDSTVISEVGQLKLIEQFVPACRANNESLKIAWSGVHVYRKALPLLLNALEQVHSNVNWELNVLGEGALTGEWKALAKKNNVDDFCRWHGWLDKKEAVRIVQNSHVFIISSLSDLTSTVTLEALSLGLPIICLDHCGFADVVNERCGIKIPLNTPEQVTKDIAKAIEVFWENESFRQQLSLGAIERVKDYSWEQKMKSLNKIYEDVTSS